MVYCVVTNKREGSPPTVGTYKVIQVHKHKMNRKWEIQSAFIIINMQDTEKQFISQMSAYYTHFAILSQPFTM